MSLDLKRIVHAQHDDEMQFKKEWQEKELLFKEIQQLLK